MSNVVPGYIMRDPEKLATFMEEMGYSREYREGESTPVFVKEPMLPGAEDWVPEDETPDAQFQDELGTGNLPTTLYRIVNERGEVERSRHSTALNKPYYATLSGVKSAASYARNRLSRKVRIQKGEVTWEDLDDTTP